MSEKARKEKRLYTLFLERNPPQQFLSTEDLVTSYAHQLEKRTAGKDWSIPFMIRDDEEPFELVACYSWGSII